MAKEKESRKHEEILVSVVIPVFNEEVTIGNVVSRTKKVLQEMDVVYEILVVDDGSADKSADIAE